MSPKKDTIIALIVTHNRLKKLQQAIDCISQQAINHILVIDAGSTDGTAQWLNNHPNPKVESIHTNNIGGAGGFSLGAHYALQHFQFDWIVFFDDDAYADPNLIEHFQQQDYRQYQLVGSKVYDTQDQRPQMNQLVIRLPKNITEFIRYIKNRQEFLTADHHPCEVKLGSFVGLFIRQHTLQITINDIRMELFLYYDDAYYTLRCTQQGMHYYYDPQLVFTHDTNNQNTIEPWKLYLLARNQCIQKRNYASKTLFALFTLAKSIQLLRQANKAALKKFTTYKAIILGLKDGLTNNYKITKTDSPITSIQQRIK